MRPFRLSFLVLPLMAAVALVVPWSPAAAAPIYGTLSNFDVFNDTTQPTHGFEIELEGLSSADVLYTFGAPYQRYGNPTKVSTPTGVIVRYASPYDPNNKTFTQSTPIPPLISPTLGHQCWTGGSAQYATSGCEHFGVSLRGNPTKTIYRWLVGDPATGNLNPLGRTVNIPAPVWNVIPQPPPAPALPPPPPVVRAVIVAPPPPAPPPAGQAQWGEAIWMKIFKTELPENLDPEDLVHLVLGDADIDIVPNEEIETEIEWKLLQSAPPGKPKEAREEDEQEEQAAEGNEAVVRRYEFYKYVGLYEDESHEALCDDQEKCPDAVGDFIGGQNAAVNLVPLAPPPPAVPEPATLSLVGLGLIGLAAYEWRRRSHR